MSVEASVLLNKVVPEVESTIALQRIQAFAAVLYHDAAFFTSEPITVLPFAALSLSLFLTPSLLTLWIYLDIVFKEPTCDQDICL